MPPSYPGNLCLRQCADQARRRRRKTGRCCTTAGDSGQYRKLPKRHPMVFITTRWSPIVRGNTTLMRLSTNDEHADCFNNVVLATAGSGRLAILDSGGTIDLYHNWLSQGWVDVHGTLEGEIDSWGQSIRCRSGLRRFEHPGLPPIGPTAGCVGCARSPARRCFTGACAPAPIRPSPALYHSARHGCH